MLSLFELLARLPQTQRESLQKRFQKIEAGPEEAFIRYGETDRSVFFLEKGKVAVEHFASTGRLIYHSALAAPDFFGHFAALAPAPRTATVAAVTECTVYKCDADAFLALMSGSPDNALLLMTRLAALLRDTTERLNTVIGLPASARLVSYILSEAQRQKTKTIAVPSMVEWASYLNMTRESLSRALSALIGQNLVAKKNRQSLTIRDAEGLRVILTAS